MPSNAYVHQRVELSSAGALLMLHAAVAKAEAIGVPQCIAIVDRGGHYLAFVRMDGAKVLSEHSATRKAISAVSSNAATGAVAEEHGQKLALATDGVFTNLPGGLPIVLSGQLVGGIGVGSGTGDQDRIVAEAAIESLQAAVGGAEAI